MEVSGEVADLLVKEGLEAAKIATELSAKGLVNAAALLAAMVKQHYKVVGKVGIERLMKENTESVIIPIKAEDYARFEKIAKQFGVLFAAVKQENKETGVLHIISNVNYSAQLNAVMEAMGYPLPEVKQEEQAAKEAHSQELAKAREEKRKAEKREFTARKKAGLLTPEEQAADEARLAHNRAWQKEWREKRKATEPPKPPKPKSLKELAALQKAGADLTPEEAERLAAYRERKNRQHKAWYERQKAAQPPKPRTLKELAAALDAGQPLTPEETERLEASRSRKKNAYQELKAQAETDPAAAAELARRRAYHSEATKKSRQKMYEEAAAGNPEAQARYENFLAARRENYHKKKQDEKGEQIA